MPELTWYDKQTWECGYTPKCCSCKFAKKGTENKNGKETEVWWCYRKRTLIEQNTQYKYEGRVTKKWNGSCPVHIWKYADGMEVDDVKEIQ